MEARRIKAATRSPSEAVASVWQGHVGNGEFAGTAFFISPSLLLTAKHVLDAGSTEPFYLGSVGVEGNVPISKVHSHDRLDIALIELAMPTATKPWARMNLEKKSYQGIKADFFGVNRDSKGLDANLGHTIGSIWREREGYLCDHQVLPGFSGAIVAYRNEVIGLITQRHADDQQTLFIPLYLIKEWLNERSRSVDDADFKKYFVAESMASSGDDEWKRYCETLEELAIFIDRPKLAFSHISQSLEERTDSNKPAIKACLCLWSSKEHKPWDFARGLAFQLTAQARGINRITALNMGDVGVETLSDDTVTAKNYEQFKQNCNRKILEFLKDPDRQYASNQSDDESNTTEFDRIKRLMQNQVHAKVFFLKHQLSSPNRKILDWFRPNREKKMARQIMAWIIKWNQEWESLNSTESMLPVVLLFCVQLDEAAIKRVDGCFELAPITTNDFDNWVTFAHEELAKENWVKRRRLDELKSEFTGRIESVLTLGDLGAAVPYRSFVQGIKSLAGE